MGYGDLFFLAIMGLLVGLLAWHYLGPRKRRQYNDTGDYGLTRPERNDDGQGGGGLH